MFSLSALFIIACQYRVKYTVRYDIFVLILLSTRVKQNFTRRRVFFIYSTKTKKKKQRRCLLATFKKLDYDNIAGIQILRDTGLQKKSNRC